MHDDIRIARATSPASPQGLALGSTSLEWPSVSAWVYIMTNRKDGTLYVGVTSDLPRRVTAHRNGESSFTRRYQLFRLVHAEPHNTMPLAIQREKTLKGWPRAWKVRLITEHNPDWEDLYDQVI